MGLRKRKAKYSVRATTMTPSVKPLNPELGHGQDAALRGFALEIAVRATSYDQHY